jgi:hypothetical protein
MAPRRIKKNYAAIKVRTVDFIDYYGSKHNKKFYRDVLGLRRGVKILMPATTTSVCHMAFIADPDDNRICLHQRKDGTAV